MRTLLPCATRKISRCISEDLDNVRVTCTTTWTNWARINYCARIIQKIYLGYKSRKKLILFKKLPSDLWNIILYYSRYQHNIQTKFKKSIIKIYEAKHTFLVNVINLSYNSFTLDERRDLTYKFNTLKNTVKLLRNRHNNLNVLFNNYQDDAFPEHYFIIK
jgi:hypothetical protein